MASFCPVRLSFRNDYLPNNDELPPIQYQSPEILNLLKQTIPRFNFFGSIKRTTLLDLIIENHQNNTPSNQEVQENGENNSNSTDYLVGILSIWIVVTAILCFWCLLLVTCRYNQRFQKTTLFSGKRPITNPPPANIDTRGTTISSNNNNNKTDVVTDEENWKQRTGSQQSIQEKEFEKEQDLQDRISSSIVMDMEDYENDENDIADANDIRNRAFLQDEDDEEEVEEEKVDENDDAPPLPLPQQEQQEVLIVSQPPPPPPQSSSSSSPPKSPSRNGQQSNNTSPPKSPKIAPSPKDTPLIHPPPDSSSTTLSSSAPQIPLQNQNDDNNDENVPAVTTKKSYVTSTKYDEYIRYLKDAATSRPNLKILLSRSSGDGSSGGYIGSSENTDSSEDDDDVLLEQCLSDPENFIKQSLSLTLPPTPSSLSQTQTQTPSSMGGDDHQDQEDKETTSDTNNINDTTSIFNSLNTTDTSFPDQEINLSLMNPSTVRLPTTSSGSGNDGDDDDPINGSGFLLFQDDECDTSGEQQQQYNREGEEENSLLFANRSQAIISRNIGSGSSSKMTMMHQPRHHQPVYTSSSFSSPPSISNSSNLVTASLPHSNYSSHAASRKRLLENYVESFRSSSTLSVDEQQQQQRLQQQESYNNNNISIHSKSLGSSAVVVDYSQIHPTLPDSTRSMIVANAAETSTTNFATTGSAFTPTGSSKVLINDNTNQINNNNNNLTFQYDLTDNTNTMDTLQYYDLSAYERDQEEEEEEKKQDGQQQQHRHNYSIQKHQMHDEAETPEQRPFPPPNYQYNLSQKRGIDDDDDYGDKNSENDDKEVRSNVSPRALSLGGGGGGGSKNNTPRPSASKLNKKYTSSRDLAKAWKEWSKQENRYDCQLQIFRIAVVLLSTLLIVSALLFTLNGVLNLNEQTSSIQQSWEEDIQDKANQLDDFLQTLQQLQNSVLQQTWNIWQLLDQSCPFVVATREPSTNMTTGAGGGDADGGVCSSNYSCNVAGLPLEDEWNDWLQFAGQENVANLYQGENWTSLQIDLDRLIFFDDDKQNGNIETYSEEGFFQRLINNSSPAMYFSWSLWTTCACNSFLALLALIIMAGTSFNINYLDTRWFGVLFWLFVFLAWVFATVFWIGLFVTADACTGGGDDDNASGTDHQENSYPNKVVSALLENRVQPNSILAKYWEYYIDGCHAEDYPSAVNDRVWLWANLLPPTQRLANGLESLDSIEFVQTCGTVVDPLTNAASVLSLQLCMVTQAMVNIRRLLACDQWYPSYESIVYDSVCFHGSQGLVWGAAAQITILLSAFMIWTLRAAFLPMREILDDDDVEEDEKYDDDGDKLSKKEKNGIGSLKVGCCSCCPTRSEDEQGGEFPTPQETA